MINIEPEEDVRSLQKYIVKLTNNAEEKSFHSKFYQIFEAFISLSCKEILPEGFSLKEWDLAILQELEFASQFFLLGTTYKEPTRRFKSMSVQSERSGRIER